ncbi:MAG: 4Fe-4S ferredoxin iron-sulfur binding domain protein [Parcubacteria group bacterium GW2011_GWA2_47_9]|uniref:Ferredoxin n=1 Tax=Candidatus Wildermuthbacteria bacterium RIFCSPHIGHO2_02_FULL_47_17 TaxID=1802452 RepID=A0A1G2R2E8_9BACT|nr:MAG: 4Fe-4S ferredoxin iron-sulfur binding domain protein [Parcubacteria group bacterium GW2011_GWA2_47_9]OHA66887.1 MAG: hypothetical protein A3D59_04605 [Candidatus Wildermuthbacteria bacterium RIFCSPHIGHO2_02_FULL_47_17]
MKIIHQRDKCIGCGVCAVLCPEFFEMGEDVKADLKGSKENKKTGNFELVVEDTKCAGEAAEGCPVEIIKIVKDG